SRHTRADERRSRGGEEQNRQNAGAHPPERPRVVQPYDASQDRDQNQWHHDHLEQPHVAATHQPDPRDSILHDLAAEAVHLLQSRARKRAEDERKQYRSSELGAMREASAEPDAEKHEDGEI